LERGKRKNRKQGGKKKDILLVIIRGNEKLPKEGECVNF